MDNQAIEARFGVMVNGCVAVVNVTAVHAVLALDEAHGYLVNARVVAAAPPSERWYRLLDQFRSQAAMPPFAPSGPLSQIDEHAGRVARDLFVAAAAFLAAEAGDLDDRISLLTDDRQQEQLRVRLDDIVNTVGDAADTLIGRVEDGTCQEFSNNVHSGSDPSRLNEARQPTRARRLQAVSRTVRPAAVGSAGVVITILGENLRRDAPQTMMIIVVAALLISLGLLLGSSWTNQFLQSRFSRQAEERRRLNEEWSAIHAARQQQRESSRCASAMSKQYWYEDELPYDDD